MASEWKLRGLVARDFRQTHAGPEISKPAKKPPKPKKKYHIEYTILPGVKPWRYLDNIPEGEWKRWWGGAYKTEKAMIQALNNHCKGNRWFSDRYKFRGVCPDGSHIYL